MGKFFLKNSKKEKAATEKEAVDCKDSLVTTIIARWENSKGDN